MGCTGVDDNEFANINTEQIPIVFIYSISSPCAISLSTIAYHQSTNRGKYIYDDSVTAADSYSICFEESVYSCFPCEVK